MSQTNLIESEASRGWRDEVNLPMLRRWLLFAALANLALAAGASVVLLQPPFVIIYPLYLCCFLAAIVVQTIAVVRASSVQAGGLLPKHMRRLALLRVFAMPLALGSGIYAYKQLTAFVLLRATGVMDPPEAGDWVIPAIAALTSLVGAAPALVLDTKLALSLWDARDRMRHGARRERVGSRRARFAVIGAMGMTAVIASIPFYGGLAAQIPWCMLLALVQFEAFRAVSRSSASP